MLTPELTSPSGPTLGGDVSKLVGDASKWRLFLIEILQTSGSNQIEFRYSGHVGQSDYETVLIPAIETALAEHDQVRLLAIMDGGFKGFNMGAICEDTKTGLSHWREFDRIAIATDSNWMSIGVRAMAPLFPCPMQVFPTADIEIARRWLRVSPGTIHLTELGGTAIQVQLLGKLDQEAFDRAAQALTPQAPDGRIGRHNAACSRRALCRPDSGARPLQTPAA